VEVSESGESFAMSSSISRPLPDDGVDERLTTLRGTRLRLESH
jgi:hypothetical protein